MITINDVTERNRAENALRESEARKSAIMASALDAVLTIDRAGLIVDFNAAAWSIVSQRAKARSSISGSRSPRSARMAQNFPWS